MIRIVISVILLTSILSGCESSSKENTRFETEAYIIKKPSLNTIQIDSITGDTIMFITDFYFDYNIILIDTIQEVFYHKDKHQCMTENSWNNILPFYSFMNKDDFYKCASIKQIEDIILNDSSFSKDYIYIVSNKDTIKDKRYFLLKNSLQANKIKISTRLLTEEEEYIMKAILNKSEYNPEGIQWKNTLQVPEKKIN